MQDHLNDQEKLDYARLHDVFQSIIDVYTSEDASYHSPHGVAEFCHEFFHKFYEPEMYARFESLAEARRKGEDIEGVEIASGSETHIQPRQLEQVIRQSFEMILLVGFEHGRRGHTIQECRCIENMVKGIEAQLEQGNWGHP